jgi:hypothetical protein
LNSAILNTKVKTVPLALNFARITAVFFLSWGFLILIFSNIKSLHWHRFWMCIGKIFYGIVYTFYNPNPIRNRKLNLIFGINDMSIFLARNLKDNGKYVVLVSEHIDTLVYNDLIKEGIQVLIGIPHSVSFLRKLCPERADDIYVMEENEELNIRILQEIDEVFIQKQNEERLKNGFNVNCFISLNSRRNISLVSDVESISGCLKIHIYNIYENMSRRLLLQYPADRIEMFTKQSVLQILIFGYSKLTRELILALVRNTVFVNANVRVNITVFTEEAEQAFEAFIQEYPVFKEQKCGYASSTSREKYTKIQSLMLPSGLLNFEELPGNKSDFLHSGAVQSKIKEADFVNAYFCFENTFRSVSLIQNFCDMAPEVFMSSDMTEVSKDVKIYCYYNLDDEKEIRQTEHRLNKQLPFIPIVFFGSFIEECKVWAIKSRFIDDLPKLFNYSYETNSLQNFEKLDESEEQKLKGSWDKLSYNHKESSRYAADHIWVKLRAISLEPYALIQDIRNSKSQRFYFSPLKYFENLMIMNFLPELEHNRWNVEKLIDGFVPVQDYEPLKQEEFIKKWDDVKEIDGVKVKYYRVSRQSKLLHIDLLPYSDLIGEQGKDIKQIKAIPRMIKILYEKNNLN